jgi:hypothetical protein
MVRERSIERWSRNNPTGPEEIVMTSLVCSIGIATAALVLGGATNASAQIAYPVEFTTSFPFTVGNTTVPAGSYTIRADDDNPVIMELTGGKTAVLFPTEDTQARETPHKSEVIFKRYGDRYVLKDIFVAGEASGVETVSAEGERHAVKQGGAAAEQRVEARKAAASSNR